MKAYGQYILYKEKDFSKSIENLQKEIAGNKSSITEVKETVDFLNGEIGNTVSRNEFNDRILGITSDIDKVSQGNGKWLVQLYNTDSTTSVLEDRESILPEENRDLHTIDAVWGTNVEPYLVQTPTSEDFSYVNKGAVYVGYAYTFIYCPTFFKNQISLSSTNSCSAYINGKLVAERSFDSVEVLFKTGWNSIELVWNFQDVSQAQNNNSYIRSNFKIADLMQNDKITAINCYVATPTARENISVSKVSNTIIDLDGIKEKVQANSLAIFDEKGKDKISATIARVTNVEKLAGEINTNLEKFQGTVKSDYSTTQDVENKIRQSAESITTEMSSTYLSKTDGDKLTQGLNKWIIELYQYDSSNDVPEDPNPKSIIGKTVSKISEEADEDFLKEIHDFNTNISSVVHAQTYVYFISNSTITIPITYNGSVSISLNGLEIFLEKGTQATTKNISVAFKEGWNVIEIWGGKNHHLSISTAISKHEKCQIMNCYASFSSNLKEVTTSSLFYREIFNDAGKSRIEQMSNQISLMLDDRSDETSLTLKNGLIEAITRQFVVRGEDGDVMIENGVLTLGSDKNLYNLGYDTFMDLEREIPYWKSSSYTDCSVQAGDANYAYYGVNSLKYSSTGSLNTFVYVGSKTRKYGRIPIQAGKMYCLSCYAKAIDSTISCSLTAAEYNSNTSTTETETAHTITKSVSTDWTRIKVTFLAAKSYVGVKLGVNVSKGTVYFDAFMIEQVQSLDAEASYFRPSGTATYIDGSKIITPNLSTMSANLGMVTAGVIKSNNYSYTSGNFSDNGLILDLNKSYFRSPGFYLSKDGAYFKGELQATSGSISNLIIDENVYIKNKLNMYYIDNSVSEFSEFSIPKDNYAEALSVSEPDELGSMNLIIGNGFNKIIIGSLDTTYLNVELFDVSNTNLSGMNAIDAKKITYDFTVLKADLYLFKNGLKYFYVKCNVGSNMSAGQYGRVSMPANFTPTVGYRNLFITRNGKKFIVELTTGGNMLLAAMDSLATSDLFDFAFVYM